MAIISVPEAKAGINMLRNVDDTELQIWIDAASELIENEVGGPVEQTTILDEVHEERSYDCDRRVLFLRQTPVISVTNIADRQTAQVLYVTADLWVDNASGKVQLASGVDMPLYRFGGLTVDYVAGYATPPAPLKGATITVLEHLWELQRGWRSAAPTMRGEVPQSEAPTVPQGFALPNRARELCAPYVRYTVA